MQTTQTPSRQKSLASEARRAEHAAASSESQSAPELGTGPLISGRSLARLQRSVGNQAVLKVDNITKGHPYLTTDIADVDQPQPGTTYKILLDTEWYSFRLVSLSQAPAQTNFRVLLYLKGSDNAEYEPFTAYPTP